MSVWRNVDHVRDVGTFLSAREGVSRPSDVMREASTGGTFKRRPILAGDVFGELTAIRRVRQLALSGSWVWLFRCNCGGAALRTASSINVSVRHGFTPGCEECRREL